ncbi:S41 family peptidase [Caulobacter sp. 17J80-11]|uniref:S41 family peptidase n=1 Tax=Caulobacter sp. 17J80-11 TaxID=2763502 RepID=UPI0016535ECC|nr:S41 family peptidase [Caulobacter sp. 17J80-11]MBC6983360.1 hypothetical protein [Caulobacter sp. 17J80-11]
MAAALAGSAAAAEEAPISPADLRADLRLAVETIEQNHPDLAHSVSKAELERAARRIERQLDRPMTRTEAWSALAQLNPVLAGGHLFIGLPDWRQESARTLAEGGAFFPFEVSIDAHGAVRIASALGGGPTPYAGRRIRRIDGRDAGQVVRTLSARVHGDTPAFRSALLAQRWWLYYAKLYGAPAAFELDLAGGGHLRVAASRERPALLQDEASFERTFRCEVGPRGAVLTAGSFAWPDKARYLAFTQDCFARIAAAGADRLVVDLRRNGGGDDDYWREGLLLYIAGRPYRHGSHYIKRVLQPRAPGEVAGQLVSGEIESETPPQPAEALRFKGQVYVLVGPQTYSSAVLFSNVVQDYGFGRVAGVGGAVRTRQSGAVQSLRLSKTGLVLFYPRFVLDRPSGAARPAYVEPDLPIADDPLDQRAAVDVLLKRTASVTGGPRAPISGA